MSKIRVDELINQSNSGPTLAVEGLRVPTTKSLLIEGIISLNGDTGLTGQVLSRTSTGVGWSNVPLTDNNTTYTLSTDDGANPSTDKVIRLSAGGSGTGYTEIVLVAGNNVSLTRNSGRITIDSSFTDTNTVTRLGVNGQNYTDGDLNLIGTGAATITQSGRTFTINVNDDNTTYTGESGVTITGDNKIKIGQPVGPNDPVTFQQVTVSGNLIVQGTTTTSNTVTVSTQDKFINLNDVLIPTDAVADGGGIRLKGDSPHTILWSNTDDSWTSSEHFNLASGRTYKINGDEVITSTGLGNVIRASSLESVGVLSAGRWEAQTIGIAYGGTGQTNANDALNAFLPSQAANASKYLTTDGQDTSWATIPPTYNGWSVGDNSVTTSVNSNDIVRFVGTGSALVTLDNVNKRLTFNADNTTYNLSVENQQQPNRKGIRLTDNTGNFEEVVLSAGTGVTLTRTGTRLEFSVAQDLSTSAIPTFTGVDVTGTVNATTYTGSGAQLSNLTGVPNGVYGSSGVIPVISVDPTGRITNISTAPNTGAAGSGGIVAGGSDYSIQYNNNGGLAGSDKIKFEPIQGELTLKGYLVSDNIVSTGATITELQALDYIKFPSKTISERDYLNVLNGSVIYNNVYNRLEMYQDGEWIPIGGITQLGDLLDVQAGHPGDGQVLSFSSNGNRWVPTTVTAGGGIQQNSSMVVNNNSIPSGSGSLVFNSAQNLLTYTPPDISSFISSETDPIFSASPAANITSANISNWNTAYSWGDHSIVGYLQATNTDKANWNLAYSWGDHSSAGYLTSEVDTLDSVTGRGNTTINNISVGQLTAGGLLYPNTNGTPGQVLTSDGTGNIVWSTSTGYTDSDVNLHLNTSGATPGQILSWNGSDFVWVSDQVGSSTTTFAGLTDTPANYSGQGGKYVAVNSGATALEFITPTLGALTDVDVTGASNGKIIKYNGSSWEIADDTSGAGGANVTISDNPPANPTSGDLWWESDKGRLKILYSTVWVDANPVGGGGGGGSSYTNGDVDAHLNQTNPTSGYVLSWNGSDYAWVAQTTDTTYTAGTGISLSGTVFSLDQTISPTFAGMSLNGQALPFTDGTYDLGSTAKKWRFVYTDGLVAGGLTYPTSNGTPGQVLTSNGSGSVYWSTVTGGGGGGIALTNLSVSTAAAGTAALAYDNTTGVFTYTPPDLSGYSTFSGSYTNLTNKPTLVTSLNGLSDVNSTGASDGKILKYNASSTSWVVADDGGSVQSDWAQSNSNHDAYIHNKPTIVTSLNGLSDVDTTGAANNKILKHNGVNWVVANDVAAGGGNVAVGSIMIWSGPTNQIPTGWILCDGSNGSPDLRDRFVVGAGSGAIYSVGDTGGSADATLVSHSHTTNSTSKTLTGAITKISEGFNAAGTASGVFTKTYDGYNSITESSSNSPVGGFTFDGTHTHDTDTQGSAATNANLPPYYALCYIYCTAVGSNQTFVGLDDTPSSFTADKWLKVNSGGTALEWADAPSGGGSGIALTDLSVGSNAAASGSGGISYDNTSGEFTFTPPDLSGYLTSYTETDTLDNVLTRGATTSQNITTTGKIYYSNVFSQLADLPSASTYHGMFAHVHATGKGYFAHGGAWIPLANESQIPAATVINSNAAERVITGSSTTGELNASDKLTLASNGLMTLNGQLIVDQVNINGNQIQPNTADTNLKITGQGTGVVEIDDDVTITGDAQFDAGIKDKDGGLGGNGQVLSSTGTQVDWITIPSTSTNLNGSRTATGMTVTSSTGSDVTFSAVTTTLAGPMSAADKTKLDGIASGATNTAAPYYTSAISVGDGGLTEKNFTTTLKNKLDGIASGATTYTSNQATNTNSAVTFASVYATGNVTAYSDASLKENVITIGDALSKVTKLRGVSYDRKDTKQKGIGVIAQEIEEILPEVVETVSSPWEPGTEYKSVAYGNIVGVLIEAVKELKTEVDDLKKQLEGN